MRLFRNSLARNKLRKKANTPTKSRTWVTGLGNLGSILLSYRGEVYHLAAGFVFGADFGLATLFFATAAANFSEER